MNQQEREQGSRQGDEHRAILARVREELRVLCRCRDTLLEGQYRFLLERVEALLLLTET